jgi:hypothetical protein
LNTNNYTSTVIGYDSDDSGVDGDIFEATVSDNNLSSSSLVIPATAGLAAKRCDALDLLHYVRGKGFQGVVIFAHTNPPPGMLLSQGVGGGNNNGVATNLSVGTTPSSTNDPARRLFGSTPYAHAARADLHVGLPLFPDDAKKITRLCEERRIKVLLNLDR